MAKYQFQRLGSNSFQEMVQSLLETNRRGFGELVQFNSSGADGAREATWTQPPNHPDYVRPMNCLVDVPKQWIFQVKFHDIGLRGWAGAGAAVVADLKNELDKVTSKYQHPCHHYVLITNVPLTGANQIGTRDKALKVASEWKTKIPNIEVWDAADISRMLDNNEGVRSAYSDLILTGDVLSALHTKIQGKLDRKNAIFRGYLKNLVDNESKARAEEAGDDDPLPLTKVFIDQTFQLDKHSIPESLRKDVETWVSGGFNDSLNYSLVPGDLDKVSSAFPLLWGDQEKIMILAGPGYGKSTITQFLALYHAARILKNPCASALAKRLKLPSKWTPENLDAACTIRFPFRVELRRYAKWRKSNIEGNPPVGIASYIARQLIGGAVESNLDHEDIFGLISKNPTLLILDGLDEVPTKDDRDAILKDCDAFLNRCSGEEVDLQIVMSSRPQGYNGEFDRFQPLRWVINDLSEADFYKYAGDWLTERIKNIEDRSEAEERVRRGMGSEAVKRLATTLLQATVMLTIVRKKSDIPEERHKLFEKYVEVVFEREKSKNDLISRYEQELRLLHEIVGYQIHESVAHGGYGVIPERRFEELVWSVWRKIRGNDVINAIPNEEIRSIFVLSTDRLVFLSGKGINQSDIDFVIQPYREYFAANYMANHEDADFDRVFKALVQQGPYWQQVLRFFAAIAKPAQRSAWAYSATVFGNSVSKIDELILSLPARRAVIFSLPEFGRLQFEPFRKIVAGCLPELEWWTWLGQGWLVPILERLRGGEAWRQIWRDFKAAGTHPYGSNEFALWVFPILIPRESDEFPDLIQFVSTSLRSSHFAERSVWAALNHELPVDLSLADEEVLFSVLEEFPYRNLNRNLGKIANLVKRLPRSLAIRFLCVIPRRFRDNDELNVWRFLEYPVAETPVPGPDYSDFSLHAFVVEPPRWLGFSIEGQLPLVNEAPSDCVFEQYMFALFSALQKEDDPALYAEAARASAALSDFRVNNLHYESVLGPSPESFATVSDWLEYKTEVRSLFSLSSPESTIFDIASTFGNNVNDWLVFLFPPNQWGLLVSKGLVESDFVDQLRKSRWAKIASLIGDSGDFVSSSPMATTANLPFYEIIQTAVELHVNGELKESNIAHEALSLVKPASLKSEDLNNIFKSLQGLPPFPVSWAKPLIEVALFTKGINFQVVSEFWSQANSVRDEVLWIGGRRNCDVNEYFEVVSGLLELGNEAALDLAMVVASRNINPKPEVSEKLNRLAAVSLLSGGLSESRKLIRTHCMLQTNSTIEEARLYGDHLILNEVIKSYTYSLSIWEEKIRSMPQSLNTEELPILEEILKDLLSRKECYPPEIASAAVDASLQLTVARCNPISEADWVASIE